MLHFSGLVLFPSSPSIELPELVSSRADLVLPQICLHSGTLALA